MKRCRNCGATIREGDTFCRTCAMPIDETNILTNDSKNVATNDFMTASTSTHVPTKTKIVYHNTYQSLSDRLKDKIGIQEQNKDNKQYVEREGNDRTKATLFNFLGLAILVIILILILKFVLGVISS